MFHWSTGLIQQRSPLALLPHMIIIWSDYGETQEMS